MLQTIGVFVSAIILGLVAVIVRGAALMIAVSALHKWIPAVPTVGFLTAVVLALAASAALGDWRPASK